MVHGRGAAETGVPPHPGGVVGRVLAPILNLPQPSPERHGPVAGTYNPRQKEPEPMAKHYTANDMRSIAKNPTSSQFAADHANRAALGHLNVPPTPVEPAPTPTPTTEPKK